MKNRTVIFGSIIVLVAAGIFLMMWRSHIMGPGARLTAGGLVAVSSSGTPIPLQGTLPLQGTSSVQPAQATPGDSNTAFQESGGLLVSLALNPYPPSVAKASDFEVTLADASGRAIAGATISVDLTMPGMMMPPNQVALESAEAGVYRGTGRFTMRGPWRMEVIINIDGQTQSVFFDVWL